MYFRDANGTGYYNEAGSHFDVGGSGSSWFVRITVPSGSPQNLYTTFATQADAQAALDKFIGLTGFVDFSVL